MDALVFCGSVASVLAALMASIGSIGTASSWRARAMLSAREALGSNTQLTNKGSVRIDADNSFGILARLGDNLQVDNSGRIETEGTFAVGMGTGGLATEIVNTGHIATEGDLAIGVTLGVTRIGFFPSVDGTIVNRGVSADDVAVLGGDGQDTVVNHGRIVGDVVLGDGADTFVFARGGALAGDLFLGGGDDTVVIENGVGRAHIADFTAGAASGDIIDVSAFFSSFDQLEAHSHQSGDDVIIALDHNDRLVLADVQFSALNDGDFWFV